MDKKQLQQIIVILPIVLIAGIFGYYKYLLLPLSEKKKALRTELETIKREYEESVVRAARLPKLQGEISMLNQEIADMEKRLPANKDLPNLIRMLSHKLNRYHFTWIRIAPGNQVVRDYYIENTYQIPFKASYHDLALFLSDVGQMERIFSTRFSKLTAVQEGPQGATMVTGDLTFLIYTSK